MRYQIGVEPRQSPGGARSPASGRGTCSPGAFQVILPDWWPPSDAEAVDFLQRMAEAADPVPLVLYNPPHAKRVLSPDAIGALADAIPQLVGRQSRQRRRRLVSGHGRARGSACRSSSKGIGSRPVFATARRGLYSNVACLHPVGAKWWNALALTDMIAALEFETRLLGFFRDHVLPLRDASGYSNAALDKLLAAVGGWADIGTRLRWPYRFAARLRCRAAAAYRASAGYPSSSLTRRPGAWKARVPVSGASTSRRTVCAWLQADDQREPTLCETKRTP